MWSPDWTRTGQSPVRVRREPPGAAGLWLETGTMVGGAVSLLSYSNFIGQELVNPTESKPVAAFSERGKYINWTAAFCHELAKVPVDVHM